MADGDGDGADDLSPAEAFAILGNERRIDILRALWKAGGPRSFAELRRNVAPDDAGNFSYHLKKLTDHFVARTDEGYVLKLAGEQVLRAVVAGTITESSELSPTIIDERCVYCGSPIEMAYEEEAISARCTECAGVIGGEFPAGTYMQFGFPPAGLAGRTREEALDAAHVLYDSKITPMMKGVCPECAGRTSLSFEICEDHHLDDVGGCPTCDSRFEVWSVYECTHCKYSRRSALWFAALNHPAVVAFYHEHGLEETIPFRKFTADNAVLVRDIDEAVLDTDPFRFRVTIPVEDAALVVTMDDTLSVEGVERRARD